MSVSPAVGGTTLSRSPQSAACLRELRTNYSVNFASAIAPYASLKTPM
jgi:hypothetical protein